MTEYSRTHMRVGIIGTGAISHKHAQAYRNIGYDLNALHGHSIQTVAGLSPSSTVASSCPTIEEVCAHPRVDFVDVCTFPDFRLQPLQICAETHKHIQVQKPIATDLATASEMLETAAKAGIQLGVVSQHRFDDSIQFLSAALDAQRLGKILQADAYVKWYRSAAYYSRPSRGVGPPKAAAPRSIKPFIRWTYCCGCWARSRRCSATGNSPLCITSSRKT